ncbi:MAG: hydroxyacylglutathione hydrolase [Methylobacterium sp.]|nr:hydroxyacylglutathione hydrolase [Methylobacterium sp.]MCA3625241.1 hydroxyacylglutathione hydrolase [Methylobacterium sp.]
MAIALFTCLADNYAVLLRDEATGMVALVDAPAAEPVMAELEKRGWGLDLILITHGHHDHIAGVPALVAQYGARVIAPALASDVLPKADRFVREGDRFGIGEIAVEVWDTPGHCADHISFHLPAEEVIFVGDTMFTMGCGRIFNLPPDLLFASLRRIGGLPETTRIFSGHEYTLSNARFAAATEPENGSIRARLRMIEAMRAGGLPTVPTTVGEERATNVFLRARDVAEFAARREAKNRF